MHGEYQFAVRNAIVVFNEPAAIFTQSCEVSENNLNFCLYQLQACIPTIVDVKV